MKYNVNFYILVKLMQCNFIFLFPSQMSSFTGNPITAK